jgi:hypothetical protein
MSAYPLNSGLKADVAGARGMPANRRVPMMRCRHRSRVYPRSAPRCAQVGQARLAWTVPHTAFATVPVLQRTASNIRYDGGSVARCAAPGTRGQARHRIRTRSAGSGYGTTGTAPANRTCLRCRLPVRPERLHASIRFPLYPYKWTSQQTRREVGLAPSADI